MHFTLAGPLFNCPVCHTVMLPGRVRDCGMCALLWIRCPWCGEGYKGTPDQCKVWGHIHRAAHLS